MTATTTPGAGAAARRIMPVLFVGVFMSALDTAIIGPAIPALRVAFGVDNRAAGLVMSAFILCSLCSTVVMANLSDRLGRRPVYLASVALFALGSALIAVSPRFWMVVASRALQGIGAGGITPTASAVIGDLFAPAERGRALGLIGATYGMAFVLGPPLASLLLVALSWHWIFLVNLPVAAVVLYLGARALPRPTPSASPAAALDAAGTLTTFALLACFVLGITRILDAMSARLLWPWLLGAAAILLVQLVSIERRAAQPIIPLSLFQNRRLATTYFLAIGGGFAMGSVVFLASVATVGFAVTPEHAGFVLLPLVVASMFGSMVSGRYLNRLGARALLLGGFALLAVGYGLTTQVEVGLWLFLVASVPVGLGLGIVVGGAMRAIAIEEAPLELRATAQGLVNIANAIGTLTSTAAISAVADLAGGTSGFAIAYTGVAIAMLVMLIAATRVGVPGNPLVKALNP